MEQIYSVMLIIVGFILMFKFLKENKIFILAGAFFIFLGSWRIANSIVKVDLFAGGYGMVVQIVTAVVLLTMAAYFGYRYWHEYKKNKENKSEDTAIETEATDVNSEMNEDM